MTDEDDRYDQLATSAANLALRKENEDLRRQLALFEPMAGRYVEAERALSGYLGGERDDGTGDGIVADIHVICQDNIRMHHEVESLRKEALRLSGYREAVVHCLRADPDIRFPGGTWYVVGADGAITEVAEVPDDAE